MTFFGLLLRNGRAKPLRTTLTALAVAFGVAAGITMGLVTHSLRETAVSILNLGNADFSVTQKGVSDILNSVMDENELASITDLPEVESTVGVLVGTVKLNADNPLFLEIGVPTDKLAEFGVRVVQGQPYAPDATNQTMLGYRAARNLNKAVGDHIDIDGVDYEIVGIFATGQEFGDSGSMMPLPQLQGHERKPGDITIAFVRTKPGTDIDALRKKIETDNPELVTVRTAAEFGRADRNLQLISAADQGATFVVLSVGALIVTNAMMLSFLERIREFGVLRAIGWSRRRVMVLVVGEAMLISFVGAGLGVGLSFMATSILQDLASLRGILNPQYSSDIFLRALYTAAGIGFLGALYPALRAALISPLAALRHE